MSELAVGGTPLVELTSLAPRGVRLLAKLEWHNPTGSVKDRTATWMLDAAEADGTLRPGQRLLEPSSGNTGIALARLAAERGYRLTVVAPDNISEDRRRLLRDHRAEIIESPGAEGSNGAVRLAETLLHQDDWVMLFQYGNPANPLAHYESTGPEIIEQAPDVDVFVSGLGTGGTLMGVGRRLREHNRDVEIVAAEPPAGTIVSGLRSLEDGYIPPVFDPEELDGKILVGTEDAVRTTRALLEHEGLFAGLSSGAALHAALRLASRKAGSTIVVLLADGGSKYLESFSGSVGEAVERLAGTVYF